MTLVPRLRRVRWPLVLLCVAVALLLFRQTIEQHTGLSVGMFAGVLVYLSAAWLGSRLFGLALDGRKRRKRPHPRLVKDLVAALLFFVAIVASGALLLEQGILGALAGSSIILAMLGFAIRNVVADTLSGIALGLEAPYRIGDWIDIDQVARGRVIEIGWRTTRVLTVDSTYMILPNSQIARRRITNYSAPKPVYRAQLSLKLAHDLPIATAKSLIATALRDARLIETKPAPDVRVIELGSDGVTYAVRFWVSRFERDVDCRDEVLGLIHRALRAAEAEAPRMRIELHRPRKMKGDRLEHAIEVSRLFSPVSDEDRPETDGLKPKQSVS